VSGAGGSYSQSYGYDPLNRLSLATETNGWSQVYVYDAFGNRALLGGTQYYIPGGSLTPQVADNIPSEVAAIFPNNRWTGAVYDGGTPSVGNVTGTGGYSFRYDAENRLVWSALTNASTVNADSEP
jgi:hypothetical protein